MSQIDNLLANYRGFIQTPWPSNLSGRQRVIFAIYPPAEERRLRAHIKEFELATCEVNHTWRLVDITNTPSSWLAFHDYREAYFKEPGAICTVEEELKNHIIADLKRACRAEDVGKETVVAVIGTGSLFGFTHVSNIIAGLEEDIKGRLLIFFPGAYERNVYRFMDARDGFNYMAVPINCVERLPL